MNKFDFKENSDVNDLSSSNVFEISPDVQKKFDKLMGDDKIQEHKLKSFENDSSEKISIEEKFDKLFENQESYKEIKLKESSNEGQKEFSGLPKNGGEWLGEPGNSEWNPDSKIVPKDKNGTNPDGKTWGELKKEYGFETIPFKDGKPDFSEISKGKVEIDDFSDDRRKNFAQADEKMAEQRGCSPAEVKQYRKDNKYTWHEESDCRTMLKVPSEVHGNISHVGGISEIKKQKND